MRGWRAAYGSTLTPGAPTSLPCSRYWATFDVAKAVYVQFSLTSAIGTYQLELPLREMIQHLRAHHFYNLAPLDSAPSDIAETSIVVDRCGVTTIVKVYDWGSVKTAKPAIWSQQSTNDAVR
ncbi:MAG TPA: hypothetical protein VEW74_09990 [Candidatus Nitrosotalea sp.]|nr:hypothetical protein [Candidatus Nitrosotalea sp.]